MSLHKKRIGTVLSMTALVSNNAKNATFDAGKIFIDWLIKTKQQAWQVLPLHQTQLEKGSATKHIPSPYKGYGIGLDPRFLSSDAPLPTNDQLAEFMKDNNYWLEEYALFCALRDYFETDDWRLWPTGIKERSKDSLKKWQGKLAIQIKTHIKIQAQLHLSYKQLQEKAAANDIVLIGELPIYLSLKSPLVWSSQYLFKIGDGKELQQSSGVLKGKRSSFGRQIWGHPLYKWQDNKLIPKLEKLFKIRLKYLAQLFDWIKFDHAKGLFSYGMINLADEKKDQYLNGPGGDFLKRLIDFSSEQKLNILVEDVGNNLKKIKTFMKSHHIPGMKVFTYAYDIKKKKYSDGYLEIDQYNPNTFAYTTTHDTETLIGYLRKLSTIEIAALLKKINVDQTDNLKLLAKQIRTRMINSPSKMVLIALQDWLYTTERINMPGTEKEIDDPNWRYQMSKPIEELPINI